MVSRRQFCRFNKGRSTTTGKIDDDESSVTTCEIPDGGLCLSSFLVISDSSDHDAVLMGHLNPKAPWGHIGALDVRRSQIHSKGWMLPACHLMIHESPQEAASRIAREQLGIEDLKLSEPKVVSEVYPPKRFPDMANHWDIEFIFFGSLEKSRLLKVDAWIDLEFVKLSTIQRSSIARSHEDILQSAGFKIGA
jgi:ADP-ribose pyrophosphatase YjhB (NUDIX family)